MTIQFTIKVDDLPDYNENGAFPGGQNYKILVICDYDYANTEASNITLYDFAYGLPLAYAVLTPEDKIALKDLCLYHGDMKAADYEQSLKENSSDEE
jgi:hypothetical protein